MRLKGIIQGVKKRISHFNNWFNYIAFRIDKVVRNDMTDHSFKKSKSFQTSEIDIEKDICFGKQYKNSENWMSNKTAEHVNL